MHTLILGAGSAGCVAAATLSADPDHRVTLVDAGPDHPDPALLPADLADGTRNSMRKHDWGLSHRAGRLPIRFPLPRGRVVGGSSAVNTCIAVRGTPRDFDEWGELGLPDWSWTQCLPAFSAIESDLDHGDAPWHGADGPLPLCRHPEHEWVRWQRAFTEACTELGYPATPDHNAPDATGWSPHVMNKLDGRRISAAEAWLTPEVRARPNLDIRPHHHIDRVAIEQGRAVGARCLVHGSATTLRADRVVLACGAIGTPGVLLRSGLGPAADLKRLGVPVVADLPGVGARLLDHPGFAIFFRPKKGLANKHDPIIQVALRLRSSPDAPDNDLQLQPGSNVAFPWFGVPFVTLMGHVGKPKGVGRIHWRTADPLAKPVVDSRLLQHPADRAVAVTGMQTMLALSESEAMRDLATPFFPRRATLADTRRLDRFLRTATDSGYHPCGTAPMGPDTDPHAVTDGRGRVHGVGALVIADASLFPTIPTGNIHLPTLMVAHRVAQWLAADQRT